MDRRLVRNVYTAAVIGLLLVLSSLNGYVAVGIAIALLAVGLVVFPDQRRLGLLAAATGLAAAVTIVIVRALL